MILSRPATVILACTLIASLSSYPIVCRAQERRLTVAVCPANDGDMDDASRELSDAIASALRIATDHKIIDPEVAAKVLSYSSESATHDGASQEAAGMVARAKELSFAFKYREADAELARAVSSLKGAPPNHETGPVLLDAYVTRAVVAKSRGDDAGAREAARDALALYPMLTLADSEYPPSLVSIFENEKKLLSSTPGGSLSASSDPATADVYLNGIKIGVTPIAVESLPAGSYALELGANKYGYISRDVKIDAGRSTEIKEKLRWAGGGKGGETRNNVASAAVRDGVRIAEALKADRVIIVDVSAAKGGAPSVTARTIDRALKAGQRPVVIKKLTPDAKNIQLAEMVSALANQLDADLLSNPDKKIDPVGEGAPVLLGKNKEPITRKPAFWVAVGTVAAGAIAGGVLAAMSGGGASDGNVKVQFK